MADFYLIRDEADGTYYAGRSGRFGLTVCETTARFSKEKNAVDQIKKMRSQGVNVDSLVVIPCSIRIGKPIRPKLKKVTSGYVITIKPYKEKRTIFWKGNRKNPRAEFYTLLNGPRTAHTASIFKTQKEADIVLERIKEAIAILVKDYNDRIAKLRKGYNDPEQHQWGSQVDLIRSIQDWIDIYEKSEFEATHLTWAALKKNNSM